MEKIDFKNFVCEVWKKKIFIAIFTGISLIIGLVYSFIIVVPRYSAKTSMVLVNINQESGNQQSTSITESDINMNQNLIYTYSELLTSNCVLGKVIENLELNVSVEDFKENVEVEIIKSTEMIVVTVNNKSSECCRDIANEISKVFVEEVNLIYKINNIHIVDYAEIPKKADNINHLRDIVFACVVGFLVSVCYIFVYWNINEYRRALVN